MKLRNAFSIVDTFTVITIHRAVWMKGYRSSKTQSPTYCPFLRITKLKILLYGPIKHICCSPKKLTLLFAHHYYPCSMISESIDAQEKCHPNNRNIGCLCHFRYTINCMCIEFCYVWCAHLFISSFQCFWNDIEDVTKFMSVFYLHFRLWAWTLREMCTLPMLNKQYSFWTVGSSWFHSMPSLQDWNCLFYKIARFCCQGK